ncbi:LuxR family two component transcriptional regulator [Micromonospora pisi]|uniref:LuxR family two component transcriptional regulator n=1 Tax=Micromonospora pisi TaxID=589240 RepID=A0A495JEA5_9ACTN|nr:response regulator transcription factor [Micromonospora pisi]RKR86704.1 LuxR family two component transcriptional regulator [Micromonospora pisi]
MTDLIRVAIADDQALLRGGFRLLLESDPRCVVVGEAATGAAAVRLAARERPDVMLMDIRMPDLDGIEATRRICTDPVTASVRVLILTMFDLDPYVFGALRAGASGFLLKDTPPADLLHAVHVVASGHALFAPTVTRRLVAEFGRADPARTDGTRLDGLTNREREILALVAAGLSNTEIAGHEQISMATVKTHLTRLLAKLGARDRAQLVIVAYESGLVPLGGGRLPAGGVADQTPV